MKKIGERSALSKLKSQWQSVVPVFLSGIILIMLLINDLQTPTSPTNTVLHIEYLLSFIASFVLFFWILSPMYYLFKRRNDGSINNIWGILFYCTYTLVLLLSSPFALLSIRLFLQDEKYIKNISILTIVSTLFRLYYTFGVANH
jgi:uncharacterized membrane protein HdeD (DUF308 family)